MRDMQNKITLAITNCQIVLEDGILWDGTLLVSGDRIAEVGSRGEVVIPEGVATVDAGGKYLGPGFVDIHVHAGGGYNTCFDTVPAARYFLSHGETTIFPTVSYGFNFEKFLNAIRGAKNGMRSAPNVRGIYMEGPYINPDFGAGSRSNPWRHGILEEEFKKLVDEAGDKVRVWAIAPELEGISEFVKYAREVNPDVVFAVGHSKAAPTEIKALGKFRPTIQTHTMNATGKSTTIAGTPGYGPDDYCLKTDEVYCEMISDSRGIHLNREIQQLILHAKGVDKVILISDSTVYNGEAPTAFLAEIPDLNFNSVGDLAGSKLTLDLACRNVMSHTRVGITEAFLMASRNPARAVGLDGELGTVEVGKRADLVIVDDKFAVSEVILGGKVCKF